MSLKEQQDVLDAVSELDLKKLIDMDKAGVSFDLTRYEPSLVRDIFDIINYEDSLPIVHFLLDKNPLNRHNYAMFDFFLNRYDRTNRTSLLYTAVVAKDVYLVKDLLDHGANPNILWNKARRAPEQRIASLSAGVLSNSYNFQKRNKNVLKNNDPELYNWITPLEASSTPEIYDLLKSAGATLNYMFRNKDIHEIFLMILPSHYVQLFKDFLKEYHVNLWDTYLYEGLRTRETSAEINKFLWDQYKLKYPFEEFHYDVSSLKPMLSQKGTTNSEFGTCAPDAIFTILFEQQDLASHLLETDFSISMYNVSILRQYKQALDAAKTRYSRMITRKFPPSIALRRTESISNNLGESMLYPLQTCPGIGGLEMRDAYSFLNDLIVHNKFSIPSLTSSPFTLSFITRRRQIPKNVNFSTLVALYANIETEDGKTHAIGFIKNDDQWYFLDNNIGFLHKMKDNDYVLSVFLPRFLWSIVHDSDKNPEKSLFFIPNPNATSDFLNYQFITLGDRLYPNRTPPVDVLQDTASIRKPHSMILFFATDPVAAAGAAAGAATGSTARRRCTTRRKQRKHHLSRKNRIHS
jgi:hypothetical protein